jgi:hypothetical protein
MSPRKFYSIEYSKSMGFLPYFIFKIKTPTSFRYEFDIIESRKLVAPGYQEIAIVVINLIAC